MVKKYRNCDDDISVLMGFRKRFCETLQRRTGNKRGIPNISDRVIISKGFPNTIENYEILLHSVILDR